MRNRLSKGFTLVEILIVVVILGILAAIVVPQFTNATQDAQTGNIRAQLKSLQNQVELFKARNTTDGLYPDLPEGTDGAVCWDVMIDGSYIKKEPKNPFNGQSGVKAGTAGASGYGWHYQRSDGTLGACYYDEDTNALTPATP